MSTQAHTKSAAGDDGSSADKMQQITCTQCDRTIDAPVGDPFSTVECPGCGAAIAVPAQIDQFQLLRVIGRGAMGQVFQAFDHKLGRQVAIKVVRHQAADSDDASVNASLEEARALAALSHPNVVQVYAVEQKDNQPYIVMEMVEGQRLEQIISDESPLDEARVLRIAIDVAKGLRAADGVSLVHGDVKPANILLTPQGVVKLVDFGVARFPERIEDPKCLGTPQYVAPEVVRRQPIDHRADQFSLGATIYHALSGQLPFRGQTVEQVLRARLDSQPPGLRQVRTDLHEQTEAVVWHMLHPDPDQRYASHDDLLDALEGALEATLRGPAEPNVVDLSQAAQTARRTKRRRKVKAKSARRPLIFMLLAILLIAAWIAGVLWWNASQRRMLDDYQQMLPDQTHAASVLKSVKPDRDAIEGLWSIQGGGLTVSAWGEAARLNVPATVSESYRTLINFTRTDGDGSVCVFLTAGGQQVMLRIGGEDAGLRWIDGQPGGAVTQQTAIQTGQLYTLEARVTVTGDQARIEADLQGKQYVRWSGQWSSLALQPPWTGLDPKHLGLGADDCEVTFHMLTVSDSTPAAK